MLFAHGFGCDQNMWRFVWPAFADEYRIVLFDHVGAGGSDASAFDPRPVLGPARLRRRRAGDLRRARPAGRGLRRPLGRGDDGRAGGGVRARALRAPGPRRPVAAVHRRRRLRRRVRPPGHRGAARVAGQQLPRLVERDGAGDHGQRRPARARRGAHQQLLPDRPRDRRALRAHDVPVGQPRGPRARGGALARPAVLGRRDRAGRGRRVRRGADARRARWRCSTRPATAPTSARRTRRSPRCEAFLSR